MFSRKISRIYHFCLFFLKRKENAPVEARDNENLFSNVLNEMINDILTDEEMN